VDNNEAHFADAGGFVSPSGISYIGVSKQKLGQVRVHECVRALCSVVLSCQQEGSLLALRCTRVCAAD
jgi:hypothetical protein